MKDQFVCTDASMGFNTTFALGFLFTAVFLLVEHRRNAPFTWQTSSQLSLADLRRHWFHGSPRRRMAFVLLLVGWVIVMPFPPLRGGFLLREHGYAMLAWLAWETCSIVWSEHRLVSVRSMVPWIITAGVGFASGSELRVKGCAIVIAFVYSAFLLIGVLNECLIGFGNNDATGYRFAGTLHPNSQGQNAALLSMSCTYLGLTGIPSGIAIICVIVSVGALGLTRSRTAFWAAGFAAVIWAAIIPSDSGRVWPLALTGTIALTGLVAISEERLKSRARGGSTSTLAAVVSLGRTNSQARTLNSRTQIWRLILSDLGRHWVFGVGFCAFWDIPRIERIRAALPFTAWVCHSDYLEILARSGVIGSTLFVATLLLSMFVAFGLHAPSGYFVFSMFVFIAIEGFLESSFSWPGSASLFMFLLCGALAVA